VHQPKPALLFVHLERVVALHRPVCLCATLELRRFLVTVSRSARSLLRVYLAAAVRDILLSLCDVVADAVAIRPSSPCEGGAHAEVHDVGSRRMVEHASRKLDCAVSFNRPDAFFSRPCLGVRLDSPQVDFAVLPVLTPERGWEVCDLHVGELSPLSVFDTLLPSLPSL